MKELQRRLVVLVSGLLLLAAVFVSYRAGEHFEASLTPQRLGVVLEIGRSVAVVVERALAFGVPFDQLAGAERFLEAVKLDHLGVDYIIITTPDGQLRYSTDLSRVGNVAGLRGSLAAWNGRERSARIGRYFNTAIAINGKGRQLGWLHPSSPSSTPAPGAGKRPERRCRRDFRSILPASGAPCALSRSKTFVGRSSS
jgi:hypothetical protein